MRRGWRWAIAATAVAAIAAAGGCGSSSARAVSVAVVDRANAATEAAHTARVTTTFSATETGLNGGTSTTTATIDFLRHEGIVQERSVAGSAPPPEPASIVVGDTTFTPAPRGFGATKPWVAYHTPMPAGGRNAVLAGLLDPNDPVAPTQVLGLLETDSTSATQLSVTGSGANRVTRYRLTLRPLTTSCVTQFGANHPVSLSVDQQGRASQVQFTIGAKIPGPGNRQATFHYSIDYSNYGIPVHATAPPADQTETVQQLQNQASHQPGIVNEFGNATRSTTC